MKGKRARPNPKPIEYIRRRIVLLAQGIVLEIGVGPGVNFVHYDPAKVNKVYALEPNSGMLRCAKSNDVESEFSNQAVSSSSLSMAGRRTLQCVAGKSDRNRFFTGLSKGAT